MKHLFVRFVLLGIMMVFVAGCGSRFGGADPTPTIAPVPTFTPTPEFEPPAAEQPAASAPTEEPTAEAASAPPAGETDAAPLAEEGAIEEDSIAGDTDGESPDAQTPGEGAILVPTPTGNAGDIEAPAETTAGEPMLVVNSELINVRGGPGTTYPLVGTAADSEEFVLTGRNEAGDWWQVCCFAEQSGWIYGPLAEVKNAESVAIAANIPAPPVVEAEPAPDPAVAQEPVVEAPETEAPQAEAPAAEAEALAPGVPLSHSGTAGNFDPRAQYQIVDYRVRGYDDNNGGIFNNGGQHMIFVNVIDVNGNGIDGAVIKDAVNDKIAIVTGAKGPGRAEFEMFGEKFKLYVASDGGGDVSSQISNQMDTVWPHIPDIIGKLGPVEEELSICPTPDIRCEPPFYRAHWSYEVTFQKVK